MAGASHQKHQIYSKAAGHATNRLADTVHLMPQVLACLPGLVAGQVLHIE
jgi:hypothetical protein